MVDENGEHRPLGDIADLEVHNIQADDDRINEDVIDPRENMFIGRTCSFTARPLLVIESTAEEIDNDVTGV